MILRHPPFFVRLEIFCGLYTRQDRTLSVENTTSCVRRRGNLQVLYDAEELVLFSGFERQEMPIFGEFWHKIIHCEFRKKY